MAGRFDPVRDSVTRSPTSEERGSASIEGQRVAAVRKPSRSASIADLLNEDGGDTRSSYSRQAHPPPRQPYAAHSHGSTYEGPGEGERSYSPAPSYAESGDGEHSSQRAVPSFSSQGRPTSRSSYSQHDDPPHSSQQRRAMEPSPLMIHRRDASPSSSSHVGQRHAPSHSPAGSIRQERSPSLFHVLNSGHYVEDGRRPSSSDSSQGLGPPYNGGAPSSHAHHSPHGAVPSPSSERASRFGGPREVDPHVRTSSLEVQHPAHQQPPHLHHPAQHGRLSMRTSSSTGSMTEFAVPDVPMRSPESMRARVPLPHASQSPQYGHAQHPQHAYPGGGGHPAEYHDPYARSPHAAHYEHHAPHPHNDASPPQIDRHVPHPLHISTAMHSPNPAAPHTPYGAGIAQSPMRFPPTPGGFAQTPGEFSGPQGSFFSGRHSSVDPAPPALPPTHHHHGGRYSPSPPSLPHAHAASIYEREEHHSRASEREYYASRAAYEEEAASMDAHRAAEERRHAEHERLHAEGLYRAEEDRRYAEQRAEDERQYAEHREEEARRFEEQRDEEHRRYAAHERMQAENEERRRATELQRPTSPPPPKRKKSTVVKEKHFVVREEPVELPAPKFQNANKEPIDAGRVKSSPPEVKEPDAVTISGTTDDGVRGKQKGKIIELPTPQSAPTTTAASKRKAKKAEVDRAVKSARVDAVDGPAEREGQDNGLPPSPQLPPYQPTVRVSMPTVIRLPVTTADLERLSVQTRNPLRQRWRDEHPHQSDGWREVLASFDAVQRRSQAANAAQIAALTAKKRKRNTNEASSDVVEEPLKHANGSLVAAHYNNRKDAGLDARKMSPILPLRDFNNWVKTVLIKYYGRRGGRVFDIGGGKGGDLGKWDNAGVREWILADIAAVSVDHARQRYQEQRRNFSAEFFAMDCFGEPLADHIPRHVLEPMFDNVSLQFCLHYGWETVPKAQLMLENVSRYLRPGGSFIGTMPDCDTLRMRLERALEADPSARSFGNSFYNVAFDNDDFASPVRFRPFGERYSFTLLDAVDDVPEYVVDWDQLEQIANQNGLTCVYKQTFEEAWLNEGTTPGPLRNMLRNKMRIPANANVHVPMDADLWEAVTLYTAFAFEKQSR